MLAYLLGFLVLNVLAGEYVSFDVSTTNKKICKGRSRENPARGRLRTKGEPENGFLDEKHETSELRQSLTWNKAIYSVRLGNGETKKLIGDISGFIESGTMALMGASGAGKSTLLDALSMRTIGASTMDGSSVELKADGRGFSKTHCLL